MKSSDTILVTGATGYVGGRLTPLLLADGYRVRVLVRSPAKLKERPWAQHENLEIIEGDLQDREVLRQAVQGSEVAYYLVHSMAEPGDFSAEDRSAAYNMAEALQGSGVRRVIYLSGVTPDDPHLSPHLKSRAEVGRILSLSGVPVTILQACQIIGVGSASFEMLRYLVDRLPVMIVPRWVNTRTQPISMSNVLRYLTGLLDHPESAGQTYDIGGPDVLSYRDLLNVYAEVAGLPRRRIWSVPGMSLKLSSFFVGMVTPVPNALARALIEGLRNEVVCKDERIRDLIPQKLLTVREATARALGRVRNSDVDTRWSDAGMPVVPEWLVHGDPSYAGGMLHSDAFQARLKAAPGEIWPAIEHIGGETGWYGRNILWKARGVMDRLLGGPGTQRGRRSQEKLRTGDSLDFWRVMEVRPNSHLLLFTEMRLPGEGILDITLTPVPVPEDAPALTDLVISLYFRPKGLLGQAYWHAVKPLHALAFKAMLRAIARAIGKSIATGPTRTEALPLNRIRT